MKYYQYIVAPVTMCLWLWYIMVELLPHISWVNHGILLGPTTNWPWSKGEVARAGQSQRFPWQSNLLVMSET